MGLESPITARRLLTALLVSTGACVLLSATSARALDLTLEAFHDAEYSTNLGRNAGSGGVSTEEEEEGWIQQPGAKVAVVHESPAVSLSGTYDARRRIYDDDAFDDDTVVTGEAAVAWRAVADRLVFDASNTRTETTIDSRDAFAPDNRQVTSTSTVGATLRLDSFSNHFINVGYQYELENTNETDSDSRSHIGNLAYVVPLSAARRVQLNGTVADEDFDDDLTPDTTSYSGDLQYVSTGPSVDVDLAVGYTLMERELARDDVDGVTGRGSLTWHLSSVTAATIAYAHEITSDTPSALEGIPDPGQEFDDNSQLNEVYTSDNLNATFETEIGRNLLSLGASYRALDYEDVDSDEDTMGAVVTVERRLRPTVRASLFSSIERTEFDIDGRQDDRWDSGIRIDWEGFRRLTLGVSASYYQQTSDDEIDEYDEWRGVISIGYLLIGTR